jgi:hypothetical protein
MMDVDKLSYGDLVKLEAAVAKRINRLDAIELVIRIDYELGTTQTAKVQNLLHDIRIHLNK